MKKIAFILVLITVVSTILTVNIFAAKIPLRVVVNGNRINFPDAQPFIDENGRTQVPVRFVSEALG
ncbi:stalk domain-containing protein, partial [Acetivibrio saccincola]